MNRNIEVEIAQGVITKNCCCCCNNSFAKLLANDTQEKLSILRGVLMFLLNTAENTCNENGLKMKQFGWMPRTFSID